MEHTRFLLLTRSISVEGCCSRIEREARKIAECTSHTPCVLLSFFFPRLSSVPLTPPRALMKEGAWTCALLSGRYFSTRLVTLGVPADYQTQQLGSGSQFLVSFLKDTLFFRVTLPGFCLHHFLFLASTELRSLIVLFLACKCLLYFSVVSLYHTECSRSNTQ